MIQEAFQRCLNATAPMAGHHGYAPAPAFRQNAFGALGAKETDDKSVNKSVATQVAALMYQSQLTVNMATTSASARNNKWCISRHSNNWCMRTCISSLPGSMQSPSIKVMKEEAWADSLPAATVADTLEMEIEHAAMVVAVFADGDAVSLQLDIPPWQLSHTAVGDNRDFHRASLHLLGEYRHIIPQLGANAALHSRAGPHPLQ
jgi:hypothetical protein